MSPALLLAALVASGFAAQEAPQKPPPARSEQEPEAPEAPPTGEAEETTDAEAEAEAEQAPEPPPPPTPPDGILPLEEIVRVSYAPRERPVVALFGDTLVVVTTSGKVDGYDAATGELSWRLGYPGEAFFRPHLVSGGEDERLLVASSSGRLLVLELSTGAIREELDLEREIAMAPLARGSELAFVTPSGEVVLHDWRSRTDRFRVATGEAALGLAWSPERLVVSGEARTLTGVDARDGRIAWTWVGRGPFRAAATIADNGRVYAGDDLGEFYSLSSEDGKVKFRWSTGGAVRVSPFVEGDRVYVATFGNNLYCYGAKGGSEQWRTALPGRPLFGPARVQSRFVIVTLDGVFLEVQPQTGRITTSWAAPGEIASAPAFHIVPRPLVSVTPGDDEGDLGEPPEPPEPLWFERSRVAFSLRNGDVVLLKHELPKPPQAPEAPETPDGETPPPGEAPPPTSSPSPSPPPSP